jgi:hypothetical protein
MVFNRINRKCSACGEKVSKKFGYCPHCGHSFKQEKEKGNFGMLGRDDYVQGREEVKMPFGFNKLIGMLMKQIDKEMGNMVKGMQNPRPSGNQNSPANFKIRISNGPGSKFEDKELDNSVEVEKKGSNMNKKVSKDEIERRKNLPKIEAKSNVRRLSDRIIYEIGVPGVSSMKDMIVTKLEDSVEVRGYSKSKCFYKTIPLKEELLDYYLTNGQLFVELKGQ